MCSKKIIGIVGGVGPYAGLEVCKKILDNTESTKDQEHLPIILMSMPGDIEDRSLFVMGQSKVNPAFAISEIIKKLENAGASVIGIPCNTAHAPQIFNAINKELNKINCEVKLINMIEEVADFIKEYHPNMKNIGILSVNGTYNSNIYKNTFELKGLNVIMPHNELQNNTIHKSVYDQQYGIKAQSNPVTEEARSQLFEGIEYLKNQNAEAVVLGCTEMSLAISERKIGDTFIIDSTVVLARALIREVVPKRLKNF